MTPFLIGLLVFLGFSDSFAQTKTHSTNRAEGECYQRSIWYSTPNSGGTYQVTRCQEVLGQAKLNLKNLIELGDTNESLTDERRLGNPYNRKRLGITTENFESSLQCRFSADVFSGMAKILEQRNATDVTTESVPWASFLQSANGDWGYQFQMAYSFTVPRLQSSDWDQTNHFQINCTRPFGNGRKRIEMSEVMSLLGRWIEVAE